MMKDPAFLITVVSVIWLILIGLFKYIIKDKDKKEDSTSEALDQIKALLSNLNVNITSLKSDLENNIYTTRGMQGSVAKLTDLVQSMQIKITVLNGFKTNAEKEITELRRQLNRK